MEGLFSSNYAYTGLQNDRDTFVIVISLCWQLNEMINCMQEVEENEIEVAVV